MNSPAEELENEESGVPEAGRAPGATDEVLGVRGLTALIDTLTKHSLLLIGIGLLVIKLLTIAEFSTSTALTIIQSTGITSTLFGIVLPVFPWLVGLLGLFIAIRNAGSIGPRRVLVPLLIVLVLAALLPATLLGWVLLGATIVFPVIRASPQGLRWANARTTHLAASVVLAAAAVVLVSAVALDRSMWLPAERVGISATARSGTEVNWIAVGYVLSSDNDWTVVLTDSPRAVLRVRTPDVTSRGPCRVDEEVRSNSILRAITNAIADDRLAVSVPPPCPSAIAPSDDRSTAADTTLEANNDPPLREQTSTVPGDLAIPGQTMLQPNCLSEYIVLVGSFPSDAVDSIIETLDRFPGTDYIRNDQACLSLAPVFGPNSGDLAGNPIYTVIFGPYGTIGAACEQLDAALPLQPDAYIRTLDNTTPVGAEFPCF